MLEQPRLFYLRESLESFLRQRDTHIQKVVDDIPQNQFLNSTDERIKEYVVSLLRVDALELHHDLREMETKEAKIDVSHLREHNQFKDPGPKLKSGTNIIVAIPYSGLEDLWHLPPNSQRVGALPFGAVEALGPGQGLLKIQINQLKGAPVEDAKQMLAIRLEDIQAAVAAQRNQIRPWNDSLETKVAAAIRMRRELFREMGEIADTLNIPLKKRDGAPDISQVPLKRKLVRPLPPEPKGQPESGFGISDEDYSHILKVIRLEGRSFETTPKTFRKMHEEELRDVLLAHLGGHYEAQAHAEAFRKTGKTDIKIETDSRAAFIAECKIWKGEKDLIRALYQLLGYLTWRDCKTALILFNKDVAKFSLLLPKIPKALRALPEFRNEIQTNGAAEWRFVFASKRDESFEITVHVFAFDISGE